MLSGAAPPSRLRVLHIRTGNQVTTQFNPQQVELALGVSWNRLTTPGASHQPLQYAYTENLKTNFDLGFDAHSARDLEAAGPMVATGPAQAVRPEAAIRFFMANHYVEEGAQDIAAGSPSPLLLVWPGFLSLIVKPVSAALSFSMWTQKTGAPRIFVIKLSLESDAKNQIRYDEVLRRGLLRHTETSDP